MYMRMLMCVYRYVSAWVYVKSMCVRMWTTSKGVYDHVYVWIYICIRIRYCAWKCLNICVCAHICMNTSADMYLHLFLFAYAHVFLHRYVELYV